jgi:hypothetical protein
MHSTRNDTERGASTPNCEPRVKPSAWLARDVYVVLTEITTSARAGASIAAVALVFLIGLWHVFPVVARLRCDQ